MITVETDAEGQWLVLGYAQRTRLRPGWILRPLGWNSCQFFDAVAWRAEITGTHATFTHGPTIARYPLRNVEITSIVFEGDSYRAEYLS